VTKFQTTTIANLITLVQTIQLLMTISTSRLVRQNRLVLIPSVSLGNHTDSH